MCSSDLDWRLGRPVGWAGGASPEAVLGGYALARTPGTELRFQFEGTSLDLVTKRGPAGGSVEVWVDGIRQRLSPGTGGGRQTADLYWPADEWQHRLSLAAGLPDGTHEAVVRTGASPAGGTEVVLDGLIVDGPTARDRLYRWILGLALVSAGAIWSVATGGKPKAAP